VLARIAEAAAVLAVAVMAVLAVYFEKGRRQRL
jgi:hypothetical protein